ncbi:MAG: hypothetical protein WBD16_14120 [Pyrinomonadaceae bacterium]
MTPNEQIETLRKMAGGRRMAWLARGCGVAAFAFVVAGFWTGQPVWFAVAAFVAVVAWSSWQTSPHVLNAARALDAGYKSDGNVVVTITEWSDSPTYHATVPADDVSNWRFEFIPIGWTPTEGDNQAILFRIKDVEWPVLLQFERGIAYPRSKPKRIDA